MFTSARSRRFLVIAVRRLRRLVTSFLPSFRLFSRVCGGFRVLVASVRIFPPMKRRILVLRWWYIFCYVAKRTEKTAVAAPNLLLVQAPARDNQPQKALIGTYYCSILFIMSSCTDLSSLRFPVASEVLKFCQDVKLSCRSGSSPKLPEAFSPGPAHLYTYLHSNLSPKL